MYDLWFRFRTKSKWCNKIYSSNNDKRWRKRNHYTERVITKKKNLVKDLEGIQKALINQQKGKKNVNIVVKVGLDKYNIISYI